MYKRQGRMWPQGEAEPGEWQVERTEQTPELQDGGGFLLLDAWSSLNAGQGMPSDLFFDDIVVMPLE